MPRELPTREAVIELLSTRSYPFATREIAARLQVKGGSMAGFKRFLDNLALEGVLRAVSDEKYVLEGVLKPKLAKHEREGTLHANARGFGFVRSVGFDNDLFIPEIAMGGALHGDLVIACFVRHTSLGDEGEIVQVVKRQAVRVAGLMRKKGKSTWLEPDDTRVRGPILLKGNPGGWDGAAAVANITRYPIFADECPEGELVSVLGTPGEPNVEVAKILVRANISEEHPVEATQEAMAFGQIVTKEDMEGREDLTGIPLPTIDPEDARDHDDAIWVERAEDGVFTAWIAIADVSHYVQPGTALDQAARERSCSVYLPTRAVPMLPSTLSAQLCSLVPNKVRLCLCVIVRLDAGAHLTSVKIVRGYMKSCAQLNYDGVAHALGFSETAKPQKAAQELVDGLKVMDILARMLRSKRMKRGALAFELPEPKIILDPETGAPTNVERRAQDPGVKKAYEIVEEMMLLANEVVATYLVDRGIPGIFRCHGSPDEEKLERFVNVAEELGLTFNVEDAREPKKLASFLKKVAKNPRAEVLNMLLLRSMKQAYYDINNIGHFGLACPNYLHFTSPIRRYPDLMVHRQVKQLIHGDTPSSSSEAIEDLRQAAQIASERERQTMDVEREVVDLYRAIYMCEHIGETFEGTVTALVGHGVYVALDSPFVDVLVRSDSLGSDSYYLDDDQMKFIAKRSGDSIGLGDRMMVTIDDVAVLRRTIYGFRHSPSVTNHNPLSFTPFKIEKNEKDHGKSKRDLRLKSKSTESRGKIRKGGKGRKKAKTKAK
jgi:ribonuclease R